MLLKSKAVKDIAQLKINVSNAIMIIIWITQTRLVKKIQFKTVSTQINLPIIVGNAKKDSLWIQKKLNVWLKLSIVKLTTLLDNKLFVCFVIMIIIWILQNAYTSLINTAGFGNRVQREILQGELIKKSVYSIRIQLKSLQQINV